MTDPRRKGSGDSREPLWSRPWKETPKHLVRDMRRDITLDCGWGRLVFAQTFDDTHEVVNLLRAEEEGRRDIAMYVRDPHVRGAARTAADPEPVRTERRGDADHRRPSRGVQGADAD
ncbi:MAG TPA: hypothetical protein VFQ15_09990 [Jiangellaceae bacterium]|nr:hypothetical protein [Jiangellaceae bacterium]